MEWQDIFDNAKTHFGNIDYINDNIILGLWYQAWVAEGKDPRADYEESYSDADLFFRESNIERIKQAASKNANVPEGQFSVEDCNALYLLLENINWHSLSLPRGQLV